MKTLNELIEELLVLQRQGKGKYEVVDGYEGEEIEVSVSEYSKQVMF